MPMATTAKANGNGTLMVQWGVVAKALAGIVTLALVSLVTAVILNWGVNGRQDVRLDQHDALLGAGERYTAEDAKADRTSNEAAHLELRNAITKLQADQAQAMASLAKATAALEALTRQGDRTATDLRALDARLDHVIEALATKGG